MRTEVIRQHLVVKQSRLVLEYVRKMTQTKKKVYNDRQNNKKVSQ